MKKSVRTLCLVLGDQLWLGNPALAEFDAARDRVLMIEAAGEGSHVWSHKARIVLFLSAMRHFANALAEAHMPCEYVQLDAALPGSFEARLAAKLAELQPTRLRCCWPGEWRMLELIQRVCSAANCVLELPEDTHFMCSRAEFAKWAGGAVEPGKKPKQLRMEFFYRLMRKQHAVLMQADGEPEGGQWNFDAENRSAYPKTGPGEIAPPALFAPDAITQEVMALVELHFAGHPGSLAHFIWPVTRAQALEALQRFIDTRLTQFGDFQDAMWTDTPYGWHALISTSLNLHLLDPREVVAAALSGFNQRQTPIASVEGFIRQVLGWREFIRGVYWLDMPKLASDNFYGHARKLPAWYWTGDTHMSCMKDTIDQTMKHGFAHHIQRLMVTGNFALMAEVLPKDVCDWYLAVYVDAVEWVELPNVAGMALNANAGRFTSKPYIASGQYIKRQSNYCKACRYDPAIRTGPKACPVSTLYWRFLDKHEKALASNPRTSLMAQTIKRLSAEERTAIRDWSEQVLERIDTL